MLPSDLEHAQEIVQLIYDMTQDEGNEIQIIHPNPDFGGPESTIFFVRRFGDPIQFVGSSVLDCLRQAKQALEDE